MGLILLILVIVILTVLIRRYRRRNRYLEAFKVRVQIVHAETTDFIVVHLHTNHMLPYHFALIHAAGH